MSKNDGVWKVMEKVLRLKVEQENSVWPPVCSGFLYQPKRPTTHEKVINKTNLIRK